MMELCKSDTEDEEALENEKDEASNKENMENNEIGDSNDAKSGDDDTSKEDAATTAADNDTSFDVLINTEKKSSENIIDTKLEDVVGKGDVIEKGDGVTHKENEEFPVEIGPEIDNSKIASGNGTSEMEVDNPDCSTIDNLDNADCESTSEKVTFDIASEIVQQNTEPESQLISLHYSENIDKDESQEIVELNDKSGPNEEKEINPQSPEILAEKEAIDEVTAKDVSDDVDNFSDDDINMDDIDRLIENADIIESKYTLHKSIVLLPTSCAWYGHEVNFVIILATAVEKYN